jgi:methionyl aminopeptidase
VILKRAREIDLMIEAAIINREALESLEPLIKPGVSTAELDAAAEDAIVSRGGVPAFKGYRGFPATLCTSLNEIVVHGIPDRKPLAEGDIVSVDIGTFYKGYAADMAKTYAVGAVSEEVRALLTATERSLYAGIEAAQVGNRLGDVAAAIQRTVEAAGFWVVREFVGHGIGREFHESPDVPNYGRAGTGPRLRPGLVLAIEPMVTQTPTEVNILGDGWTAPTANGSLSAHFEHTVAITEAGPRVLTLAGAPIYELALGGGRGA